MPFLMLSRIFVSKNIKNKTKRVKPVKDRILKGVRKGGRGSQGVNLEERKTLRGSFS